MRLPLKRNTNNQSFGFVMPLAVFVGVFALVRAFIISETDVYWQTRAGLDVLAGAPIIGPDNWSWAPQPWHWLPNSAGWNILLGLFWKLGGMIGLYVAGFMLVVLLLAIAFYACKRLGARIEATTIVLPISALLSAPVLAMRPALGAVIVLMVAALLMPRLAKWTTSGHVLLKTLCSCVILSGFVLLGVNIHLSWLGLTVVLLLSWTAVVAATDASKKRVFLNFFVSLVMFAVATCATPLGADIWAKASVTRSQSIGMMVEWLSAFEEPYALALFVIYLPCVVALSIAHLQWFRNKREGLFPVGPLAAGWSVMLVCHFMAGIIHLRFIMWVPLLSAPIVAVWVARILDGKLIRDKTRPAVWALLLSVAVGCVPWLVAPKSFAFSALPKNCKLISTPEVAGIVILLRPDVKTWIDTRNDYWGKAIYRQAFLLMQGQDDGRLLDQADCALVVRRSSVDGLQRLLDSDKRWVKTDTDPEYLFYWRRGLK
jgi:hypothetical protein